jgi:hypothetical protein
VALDRGAVGRPVTDEAITAQWFSQDVFASAPPLADAVARDPAQQPAGVDFLLPAHFLPLLMASVQGAIAMQAWALSRSALSPHGLHSWIFTPRQTLLPAGCTPSPCPLCAFVTATPRTVPATCPAAMSSCSHAAPTSHSTPSSSPCWM